MSIAALMMLKNENRFILHEDRSKPKYTMLEQNFRRLRSMVDAVYIVDNGSTDGSRDIYDKYEKDGLIQFVHYNDNYVDFDDVRDRKILLEAAVADKHKWILVVDGDEIYEDRMDYWIKDFCSSNSHNGLHSVMFNYVNFWRSRDNYRVDKWNDSWFFRLFSSTFLDVVGEKLHQYRFLFRSFNGLHSVGNVLRSDIKCLHYGWADWDHRLKKTKQYIDLDMQYNNLSFDHASKKYVVYTDESGIVLSRGRSEWSSEFRTGSIDY
jgi:glycosyltransferase involved in cell wall biosynthesis